MKGKCPTLWNREEGECFLHWSVCLRKSMEKSPWDGKSEFEEISAPGVFTDTKVVLIQWDVTPIWVQSVESWVPFCFFFFYLYFLLTKTLWNSLNLFLWYGRKPQNHNIRCLSKKKERRKEKFHPIDSTVGSGQLVAGQQVGSSSFHCGFQAWFQAKCLEPLASDSVFSGASLVVQW